MGLTPRIVLVTLLTAMRRLLAGGAMTGGRLNDSTRHLSAGVYLDAAFRDRLVREIYLDQSRRVAPSYGFSLEPVLIHARRALLIEVACDLLLLGLVAGGLFLATSATVAALLVLMLWYVGTAACRLGYDYLRYYFRRGTFDEYTHLQHRLKVLRRVGKLLLAVPLLVVAALGLAAAGRLSLPAKGALGDLEDFLLGTISILTAAMGIMAIFGTAQHFSIRALRVGSTAPVATARPRIRRVAEQQRLPVTVYSTFRPFIGSGMEIRTWSFVQRIVRDSKDRESQREFDIPPFRTDDLVRYLRNRIASLAHDPDNETRLSGLTVRDHVFVAGTKTADLPEDLADVKPLQVMADPTGHARHYLACQIESWDGEIVTTVYVHASIKGRMLYLEFSTWALPPTRQEFHVMDQPDGVGPIAYLTTVGRAIRSLPARVGGAAPRLAMHAVHELRGMYRRPDDYDSRCRGVDIGARVSARELGAGLDIDDKGSPIATATITYFQHRDVLRYAKVIERRLLASVLDFLEERRIDVSEYRQRMATILNIGAINFGSGNVTVSNSAIGEGAAVHNN